VNQVDELRYEVLSESRKDKVLRCEMHGACLINGEEVEFLADTGAAVSVLGGSVVELARPPEIGKQGDFKLVGPNGSKLQVLGEARVAVQIGDEEGVVSLPVVSNLRKSLLVGRDIMSTWSVFKDAYYNLETTIQNATKQITNSKHQNREIFTIEIPDELDVKYRESCEESLIRAQHYVRSMCEKIAVGKLSDLKQASQSCHVIKVKHETPIRQKSRPIPYNLHVELRRMLQEKLEAGIIAKSDSPYRSPIRIVSKPDGSLRITIDFRKLNEITVKDAYSVPNTWLLIQELAQ
jgi:hypothetical protein